MTSVYAYERFDTNYINDVGDYLKLNRQISY